MGRLSRDKGLRGQREAAELLRSFGFDVRRGQQAGRYDYDSDIEASIGKMASGAPREELSVEVKLGKVIHWWRAFEQASEVAKLGETVPIVMARRDHGEWMVLCKAEVLLGALALLGAKKPFTAEDTEGAEGMSTPGGKKRLEGFAWRAPAKPDEVGQGGAL